MANTRNSNTFYIDTGYSTIAESLAVKGIRVLGVIVTATSANAILVLSDEIAAAPVKLSLRVATSGESAQFLFGDTPIRFPNGIRPTTVTNCVATVIIEESNSNG
jgi:hypothetical protein